MACDVYGLLYVMYHSMVLGISLGLWAWHGIQGVFVLFCFVLFGYGNWMELGWIIRS